MLDDDGYPDDKTLQAIAKWDYKLGFHGLMDLVKENWWAADCGFHQEGNTYNLSTSGWSGNEDIICALQQNPMFWTLCWDQSRRGGHYIFEVKDIHAH